MPNRWSAPELRERLGPAVPQQVSGTIDLGIATSGIPNGRHVLTITAIDVNGDSTSLERPIVVRNSGPAAQRPAR